MRLGAISSGSDLPLDGDDALIRITKTGIDAKSSGSTLLGTTANNGKVFHPIAAIVRVTDGSGILAVGTVSIGTNSSSYNNILAGTLLTGLSALNKMLKLDLATTAIDSVPANTGIYCNVSGVFTATTAVISVTLIGFST